MLMRLRELQFNLIPIRDWNSPKSFNIFLTIWLQFNLIPIRDWNLIISGNSSERIGYIAI